VLTAKLVIEEIGGYIFHSLEQFDCISSVIGTQGKVG